MAKKLTAKLINQVVEDRHNCDVYQLSEPIEFKDTTSKHILVMKTPQRVGHAILDVYLSKKDGTVTRERPFAGFAGMTVKQALEMLGYTLI